MNHYKPVSASLSPFSSALCQPQVLVIDRVHGPADILISTMGMLVDSELSVMLVDEHTDALRAVECCAFDLIVVGLEASHPMQLIVLSRLHELVPDVPIIVVGRELPRLYRQYARHHGASDVLDLPQRAAHLKETLRDLHDTYFPTATALPLAPMAVERMRSECREAI